MAKTTFFDEYIDVFSEWLQNHHESIAAMNDSHFPRRRYAHRLDDKKNIGGRNETLNLWFIIEIIWEKEVNAVLDFWL